MVVSVGICECGCSEFGHDVGGLWEELSEPDYRGWQQHRCTKQCLSPCLVARCRDSFDGDGFWVWCRECDIQCSGSYQEWSDEPQDDFTDDIDEEAEALSSEYGEVASEEFARRWKPVDIGTQIRVDFGEGSFVITDAVILNEFGDLTRLSTLASRPSKPQVQAFFAAGPDGVEVLVNLSEITDVIF